MKNFLSALIFGALALFTTTATQAQTIGGDYNHGANPYYTTLDTVATTATDTFTTPLNTFRNSVTMDFQVTRIAGRSDSVTIAIYASALPVATSGSYKLLTTLTAANAAAQSLQYVINSGQGNPYTKYMIVVTNGNTATGSSTSVRGYALVR